MESYRLPILRIEASLDAFKLIASLVLRSDGEVPNRLQRITDKSYGLHGAVTKSELRRSFVSRTISSARASASFIQRPLAGLPPGVRLARRRRLCAGWLVLIDRGQRSSAGTKIPVFPFRYEGC